MKQVFVSFLFLLCQVTFAGEVCFPVEQAKRIAVELEQKRVLEKEIAEYETLTENLRKQNELLKKQNELLREQVELIKNQAQLYKTAYEEEKSKHSLNPFEKAKWLGVGLGLGIIIGIFGL